jgi:hypothetical protein
MMKNLKKRASSNEDRFPKTLFALSRCRITEDDGFGDLRSGLFVLSRCRIAEDDGSRDLLS